jgi:hypothetical protein
MNATYHDMDILATFHLSEIRQELSFYPNNFAINGKISAIYR